MLSALYVFVSFSCSPKGGGDTPNFKWIDWLVIDFLKNGKLNVCVHHTICTEALLNKHSDNFHTVG